MRLERSQKCPPSIILKAQVQLNRTEFAGESKISSASSKQVASPRGRFLEVLMESTAYLRGGSLGMLLVHTASNQENSRTWRGEDAGRTPLISVHYTLWNDLQSVMVAALLLSLKPQTSSFQPMVTQNHIGKAFQECLGKFLD